MFKLSLEDIHSLIRNPIEDSLDADVVSLLDAIKFRPLKVEIASLLYRVNEYMFCY